MSSRFAPKLKVVDAIVDEGVAGRLDLGLRMAWDCSLAINATQIAWD